MPRSRNNRWEHNGEDNWYNDNSGQERLAPGDGSSQHMNSNQNSTFSDSSPHLGPFTQAVDETIAKLRASQEALKSLGDSFTKHSQEIKKIPEIQQRHAALEKQSKHKDMKIKKQENTIETLVGKISAKETEVEEEMTKFNKEKEAFEEEQERIRKEAETATKRQKVRAAELANEQAKEVENLKAELNTKYEMDVKALKEDKAKWETQHEEELTRLEASNQERTQRITDLETQLERAREQARRDQERYEDIEAAKSKYKSEKEEFATKLQKLENEFSLDSHPDDFYRDQFAEIFKQVQDVSYKFFDVDLSAKKISDSSIIRKKLNDSDLCFSLVPISNSEESRLLRIAHAHRVISSALQKYVWQPFSFDGALPDSPLMTLLSDIFSEISRNSLSNNGTGHVASFWKALTTHALQSIPNPLSNPKSNGSSPLPLMGRAVRVVHDVLSVLSPLLTPTQEEDLREELSNLTESAISLWTSAEADESRFIASLTLDPANRDEWRSKEFDPPLSDPTSEGTTAEIVPPTNPRIFTLFPRITAEKLPNPVENQAGLPGSWPSAKPPPRTADVVCIHEGVGLPEWSRLVMSGKREQVEIERELEDAKAMVLKERNMRAARNNSMTSSRSGSIAGSVSSPISPSALWNRGRTAVEERV